MKKISESPTFCPAPWTSLNINQVGLVLPCMASGFLLGNVKQNNVKEILKGNAIRELKQAQEAGIWHDACSECRDREQYGASPRTQWHIEPETVAKIDQDPANFFEPHHITINWSNLCNLSCTYCNEETSTSWQSHKKIPISHVRNNHDALIELVTENNRSLKGLSLGGGEPLLQKGLVDFLKVIDPTDVSVLITTNLSVDLNTNEVYQILKTWPNVNWMISFDNVNKDKFEYVRHGANWEVFCRNIDIMKSDNQAIQAHPAYSIYCALELEEYYDFCYEKKLDLFWCDLINPVPLDVRRRNEAIRNLAIEQIDLVTRKYSDKMIGAFSTLERYRQHLVDPSHQRPVSESESDLKLFSSSVESQLQKTKTFQELWPEIWNLL